MIDIDLETIEPDNVKPKKKREKIKTWFNANDMKESEIERYKKGYNPLNPFKQEDKVILNIGDHPRYLLVEGLKPEMVGNISEVLGNNMVSIAYWDTRPSVIKCVPVTSVKLVKENKFLSRLHNLFIRLMRKILDPNKLPKKIEQELEIYWKKDV